MTNRVISPNGSERSMSADNLANNETCFDRFKGIDIITVSRNGLILSTIREKS
jgi:hypothetical protein